jgi:integrase
VAVYAYASRGGDLIARAEGRNLANANAALEKVLGLQETLTRLEKARKPVRVTQDRAYIHGLITAFKASPEWAKLGASSQTAYTHYLASFAEEFGDWKVSLFNNPETKIDLLDWRDDWADRPRAADYALQSVGRLFKWARARGLSSARPVEDVERLHDADRSDIIWTDGDLTRLLAQAGPAVGRAVRLSAETGLRLGDLVKLPWGAVGEHGIVWRTGKRGRQAVIPLTPAAKALLKAMPKTSTVVLTNTHGKPWTQGGLKTMVRKARIAAEITGLRLNDLRGTAVTRLFLAGSPKRDLATIFGWSEEAVEELLTKYCSGDAVALDLLSRMNQKPPTTNRSQTGSEQTG